MIDLSAKDLPNAILVDGKSFLIDTDFRTWLSIDKQLKKIGWKLTDIAYVIQNISVLEILQNQEEIQRQLLDFYTNPNSTPHNINNNNNDILVDYYEDGEYIYAAFMQAYNIDLINCEHLHWHKFLALFRGLTDSTMMVRIMGYRGYRKEKKENPYEDYKRMWSLTKQTETTKNTQKELEELFYGAI